jgi:hypothetical protein
MAVPQNFQLIREISKAGGYRQVFGVPEQKPYEELVELGWLTKSVPPRAAKSAHYQITERGKAAALRS